MAKSLVVFMILMVTPVFICGCASEEPRSVETSEADNPESGPSGAEPNQFDPNQVQAGKIVPFQVEPDIVEIIKAEPKGLKSEPAASFHNKCADILKEFVHDNGMVDYQGLRRKRLELRAVLRELDKLESSEYESWPREDKIAFWINVYNLQKLKIITDNYPIKPSSRILTIFYRGTNNIRHIEEKITKHKFLVMDEEFTFAAIEKLYFHGESDDPRLFFAISSGCLSSPPLRNEPYYGSNLSEQLDEQTRRFLSSPLAFSIDREKDKVYLSALFQSSWYGREFINKFAIDRKFKDHPAQIRAVLNFITNYIPKEDVTFLETGNYTIKYMTYDWTINDGS
ncbi:MAG: DUF547 domain-containing protein [Sedimentisphaerales bacterium]|nr:DUF547 domain-containing protein [Sedimentisphaerales bacterium]